MSWSRICLSGWSVGIEVSSASNNKEKYESAERNRDMKKGELCAELITPCVKTYTKTKKKKHMWVHLVPFSCPRAGVNYTLCENLYKDKGVWEFHVHALKVGVKLSSIQFRSHSQEPSHEVQVNIVPFRWNLYMLQFAFIETSSLQFNSTQNTQESILVLMLQPKSFQGTVTCLQTLNLVLVCLVWAQTLWIGHKVTI